VDLACEICASAEWPIVGSGGNDGIGIGFVVGVGDPVSHSIKGEFKFAPLSAISSQYCNY
jgi:hypothetical protein